MRRLAAFALVALSLHAAGADPLTETRYCGAPKRNAAGVIVRRADVLASYRRVHPCPSTMSVAGACPGWQMNHVVPLACGGCDAVANLAWLPVSIKTCADSHCVDRFERRINATIPPQPDTPVCVNVIVP